MQRGRLDRGAHRRDRLVADAHFDRAHEPRESVGGAQRRIDKVGGRGLAVGASNAHGDEFAGGIAKHRGSGLARNGPRVFRDERRDHDARGIQ